MRFRLRTLLILMGAAPIWVYLIAILATGFNAAGLFATPLILVGIAAAIYRLTRRLPDGLALAILLSPVISLGTLLVVAAINRAS